MAETMLLIPVRTSRQGTSLNAGKLKDEYRDETSTIEIHNQDMARLGLKKGDKIRMSSANGAECIVNCKAQKSAEATPGLIFMAYGPISSQFMEADTAGTGMPISKQMEVSIEGPLAEDGTVLPIVPTYPAGIEANQAVSPLSAQQVGFLNSLTSSQITPTQAVWLSGYFAALSGSGVAAGGFAVKAESSAVNLPLMTVLFGSETGNGEALANNFMDKANARGFNCCLEDMMNYDFAKLEQEKLLFIVVSTQGEGAPPLSALKFHSHLKSKDAPRLENLKYAVFALGDSSYEFYCQTGKDFDGFLENLGATRIIDRIDSDVDFEETAEQWMEDMLDSYQKIAEEQSGAILASPGEQGTSGKEKTGYSKTNPYQASVLLNENLNSEGSAKETRHIEIDLGDSGLNYKPGDALGVYPLNNPVYVGDLLNALKMTGEESVTVAKQTLSLRDALIEKLDITALSRVNMQKYAELIHSEAIQTLLDDEHKKDFKEYTSGRQILDLVEDFPAKDIAAQDFINVLRRIPGRLYSIASSIAAQPGQVHLLVGAVRYHTYDRDREGVCSTYLSGRMEQEQKLAIYVQPNKHFHLPEDSNTPIIMIGPGTGLAPFRAFLQDRQATKAQGKNWLFFGDQHKKTDFLYAEEMQKMQDEGLLTKLSLAFSRDQEQKIYVQDRLLEHSAKLYEWLEQGAYFYICGDAERMANDVHKALIETVAKEGGKRQQEAEDYVNDMLDSGRYQRDVY
ncbi:MAG: assimilatory sulfite reductase (NADPH) flavoprotein subunit [Methylococcales bacterium]|nr:assimilatory sulfite reductase (NADPH) flavoprotein subunit [Methylococcales bacterium]